MRKLDSTDIKAILVGPTIAVLLFMFAMTLNALGCSGNARQTTLHTSFVAVTAACDGLEALDDEGQAKIVDHAATHEEGEKKLAEFRERLDKAYAGCSVSIRAIAAASLDKEEITLQTATEEAAKLFAEIKKLKEAL